MSAESPSDSKAQLRSAIRRALDRVPAEQALEAGRRIDASVRLSYVWREAPTVAVFASLPGEVDTGPLMQSALAEGKDLLLPRTRPAGLLEFARVGEEAGLVRGAFGIPEPGPDSPAVELDSGILLLVPGLAFDRSGGRLGRGAGYYDRVLGGLRAAGRRPQCLGIGFGLQVVDRVPMTALDEKLDGFVTERELWRVV
jgi:5-formyltetrahydrofolate cyclo-ligase